MNEFLSRLITSSNIGVALGGIIGIIPTIILVRAERHREERRERHELALHKLSLIDEPRLASIREYANQLGAMMSRDAYEGYSPADYLAAYQRVAIYVSTDTLQAMQAANPIVLDGREGLHSAYSINDKIKAPEITRLYECLNRELRLSYAETTAEPHKRRKHIKNQ